MKRLIISLFIIGIAVRLFFFVWAYFKVPIGVDESIPGVMAMYILKGEFPIVYWGQSYMGTQESYFDAILIYLFGSTPFSVRFFPFLFSLMFLYFSYRLACSIYNKEVGVLALLLLAVPVPYLSIASAVVQPDTYMAIIAQGTIALLITHGLVFKKDSARRNLKFALLGFILGFALWMHLLIVGYIGVAVLFLFLKDKFLIIRKGFFLFVLSFIIGGLPIIVYNLTHNFATFHDTAWAASFPKAVQNLKELFGTTLHFLIGTKVMLCADTGYVMNLPQILSFLTIVILIGLIIIALITKKNAGGTSMLVLMVLVSIFIFVRSGRSSGKEVRYILPIMSALPIILAYGLWIVKKYSRLLFYVFLSVILLAHGWGNFLLAHALNDSALVAEQLDLQDMRPLISFLKDNNIKYAYAHYCISYNLIYVTKGEVICASPYNERFKDYEVPFIEEVRKSDNVAYIMHKNLGIKPREFEDKLKMIGGGYKKKQLKSYTVFYSFMPPNKNRELREIARDEWEVASNNRSEDAYRAIDNDLSTRWGSGAPQTPGMRFSIDLGKICSIAKIRFDLDKFITDYPRGYRIEISIDNKEWNKVYETKENSGGLFWESSHPRFLVKGDFFAAVFVPVKARYIRVTQTGSDSRFDWSIAELHVYGGQYQRQGRSTCPGTRRDKCRSEGSYLDG